MLLIKPKSRIERWGFEEYKPAFVIMLVASSRFYKLIPNPILYFDISVEFLNLIVCHD